MSSNTCCETSCCYSLVRPIPLITAAVKNDSCAVDYNLLAIHNITLLVATTVAAIAAVILFPAQAIFSIPGAIIVFVSLAIFENWRANRAADHKAANEYLNVDYPSISATNRIQQSISAARLLGTDKNVINKSNEADKKLLEKSNHYSSYIDCSLETFKYLVKNGYEIKSKIPFLLSLENSSFTNSSSFINFVLREKIVTPKDFTNKEQHDMWLRVKSHTTAKLLKECGFDVNVRNDQNYTPLMSAASSKLLMENHSDSRNIVRRLLTAGADRSLTVTKNFMKYTAHDLCKDDELKNLLKPEEIKKG